MMTAGLFAIVSFATALLTGLVRLDAIRRGLLDVPNERSSHTTPTPRGGGLAIVAVVLIASMIAAIYGLTSISTIGPLLGGGLVVAIVGYLDDHGHVPIIVRIVIHIAAALGVIFNVGYFEALSYPGGSLEIGAAGAVIATLYVVWLLNLTNFMDGIDAILGIEALTVMGAAAVLLLHVGDTSLATVSLILCAAAAGFLPWNWPPARIFMGDVGSGFVGFCFGAIAVMSHATGSLDIYIWSILLGSFIVDATVTLISRLVGRHRVYEAHRTHAYQLAAFRYRAHAPVSVAVGLINLFWLLPVSFAVVTDYLHGFVGLLIAYVPLVALSLCFRAGSDEGQFDVDTSTDSGIDR